MEHNWPYVVALLVAWLGTDLLIPHVVRFAHYMGKMDQPDPRKVHKTPIPRLGGIAIFLGFLLSLLMIEFLEPGFFAKSSKWYGIIAGSSMMFLLGVVDDLKPLPAKVKFIAQIIIASVAYSLGVKMLVLSNPFGDMWVLPTWLSAFMTVFWLVGITNTINLIDGLDGLAAGVSMIAGITLSIIAIQTGQVFAAVIILTLVGGTIGFLRYNFNPAKIFMGDSGSLFLGFTLAAISVSSVLKFATTVTILIPLLILGVPIFDTAFAIVRRAINKKPIFQPDKGHLHHRLLKLGLSQRRTVITIYSFSAFLAGIALYVIGFKSAISVIIVSIITFVVAFVGGLKKTKNEASAN
ncbi:MAG: MraY family glycosyltransferase [Candidatus Sericytochromatia bacterium]